MTKMTLPVLALIVFCSTAYAAEPAAAPPAAAATATSAGATECTTLEKKFDAADKSKVTADKLKKANSKRAEGAKQCAAGKTSDGAKYLKSALKLIGAKP
jgi:hypothetical protein